MQFLPGSSFSQATLPGRTTSIPPRTPGHFHDALPLVATWEHVATTQACNVASTVACRVARVHLCAELGVLDAGYDHVLRLVKGHQLPRWPVAVVPGVETPGERPIEVSEGQYPGFWWVDGAVDDNHLGGINIRAVVGRYDGNADEALLNIMAGMVGIKQVVSGRTTTKAPPYQVPSGCHSVCQHLAFCRLPGHCGAWSWLWL